jgi:hypothetical protein
MRPVPLFLVVVTMLVMVPALAGATTPGDIPGMNITFGPVQCGGGYPRGLCKPPMDSIFDKWGFPNRGCNSFVVWLEASSGHQVPTKAIDGKSNEWPTTLASWIVPTAAAGDVAVLPQSPTEPTEFPGHAFYIERVTTTGNLVVRQYNWEESGEFTVALVNPTLLEQSRQAPPMVYLQFPAAT